MEKQEENIKLKERLSGFSELSNLFPSVGKIVRLKEKNDGRYTFKEILLSDDVYWDSFLSLLNDLIFNHKSLYNRNDIKKDILSCPFCLLSELKFVDFCLCNNIEVIETKPELKKPEWKDNKFLDVKIKVCGNEILVEVISPQLGKNFRESRGAFWAHPSMNLHNKIKDEIEKHKIHELELDHPFLLVMDTDFKGIDVLNGKAALEKFNEEFEQYSKYLSGIFLFNASRFNLDVGTKIGNHTYLENKYGRTKITFS